MGSSAWPLAIHALVGGGSLCNNSRGIPDSLHQREGDTSQPSAHPAFSCQLLITSCLPCTRHQGYNDKRAAPSLLSGSFQSTLSFSAQDLAWNGSMLRSPTFSCPPWPGNYNMQSFMVTINASDDTQGTGTSPTSFRLLNAFVRGPAHVLAVDLNCHSHHIPLRL